MGRRISSVHPLAFIIIAFVSLALVISVYPARSQVTSGLDPNPPDPNRISIVSGNNQSGGASSILPEPLVVQVRASSNYILVLEDVKFTVLSGGGALITDPAIDSLGQPSIVVKTDQTGRARVWLILGKTKGTNLVEARVGDVDPVTFTATVVNSPPVLAPIGNKQVNEAAVLTFTVSATDSDQGDTVTLSVSNLPANASFDATTGVFIFIPNYFQSGIHTITFSASDGTSIDSETVTITVINVNRPPVLNPIGQRIVDENTEIVITVLATDPDGDPLTFSATNMPAGAVLETQQNASQRIFRWKPGYDTVTSGDTLDFYVTFTVNDVWGATDSEIGAITVRDVEPPPEPDIRVVPPIIDFGVVEVGEWSDRLFQIHNEENADLKIALIASTDPQFIILSYSEANDLFVEVEQPETIPQSVTEAYPGIDAELMFAGFPDVPPGGMLLIKAQFRPSSAGAKAGEFIIASNDPDEMFVSVAVHGEATRTPNIRVTPTSIDYGKVAMGKFAEEVLSIHNDGNGVLQILSITSSSPQFTISGHSDVAPHSKIDVVVKFTPSSLGEKNAILNIASNDPDEQEVPVALKGEGIIPPVPDILVSPPNIYFDDTEVDKWRNMEFRIYNDGTAPLKVSSITSNSIHFIVLADPNDPEVDLGGVVTIPVRFKPLSSGTKTSTLTIASNDPDESEVLVSVQGKGINPPVPDIRLSTSTLNFFDVDIGEWRDKEFRIYNDGNAVLKVSSMASNNIQFIVLANPTNPEVVPGGVVTIPVRFKPLSSGTKTGVITIVSNDPNEPSVSVSVQGKGVNPVVPDISLSTTSIDFGNVYVGEWRDREFRIYNAGNALLKVSSITSNSSKFIVLVDPDNPEVVPGSVATIPVRFKPLAIGTWTGYVTITSNDPDEPAKSVFVRGAGIQPPGPDIYVLPSSINFGDTEIGTFSDEEFQIRNNGGATLEVYSVTSDDTHFEVTNHTDIDPGGTVDVNVRFTPSSVGTKTGEITIISNDPDEPTISVSVTGRGVQPIAPDIYVAPLSMNFGDVKLGESEEMTFFIYNFGNVLLDIYSVTSDDFSFAVLDDPNVPAGATVEIGVRFTPFSIGPSSAEITIASNDPDEPFVTVDVSGVGIYPDYPITGDWRLIRQDNLLASFRDVHFVNDNDGWVVGSSGTLAYSNNGGDTWTLHQPEITSKLLKGVHFANVNIGWAVGQDGTMLRTTNGGYSWSPYSSGEWHDLNAVHLAGASRGWIVGQSGVILTTTNGTTWTSQNSGTNLNLNDVFFINSYRGWAVGSYGTILYTNNSGQTWTPQTSGTSAVLNGVIFLNYYHGWAVGSYGEILHTHDGGQTWTPQTNGVPYITLTDVDFLNSTEGWASGYNGTILYTDDGGSTWGQVNSGVNENLWAVQFRDSETGWIVGSYGTVLKYSLAEPPVIISVSVSGSPARTGEVITVVATGQPGNIARFSIAGVVQNRMMTENPAGVYIGTYTAAPGIQATNAVVTVSLTNWLGETTTDTSQTVTIDTTAAINWASVTPDRVGSGDTITVTMMAEPNGTGTFSIESVVNSIVMIESSGTPGKYIGRYTVSPGTNADNAKVMVRLTDALGNVSEEEAGHVTIDTIARVTSVSVSGSPAKFGDAITISLVGEAGGSAEFSIAGVITSAAMSENPAGVYNGSYTAPEGTYAVNATVTAKLTDDLGNTTSSYVGRVTIDTESRIDTVSVSGSPAKAGETISVIMTGESGGSAQFSIAGVVNNAPMTEAAYPKGKYAGEYVVTDGVNVIDAVLTAILTDAVGNVGADSSQRVTIDTTAPGIASVVVSGSPAGAGATIGVTMVGEPGGSAQFSIAGVVMDVPLAESVIQPGTYTGTYTVVDGTNATDAVLTVILTDAVGNVGADSSQRVTIDTIAPEIASVIVSGSPVGAGGSIDVTMVGEQGGSASFSIAGVADNLPMNESADQPDIYTGTYTAIDGINVTDAAVTVLLTDAVGNESMDASQSVTIDTTAPEIASVTVTGSPAKAGETITVIMVGEPGGLASLSIVGVADDLSMEESADQPGTYTGIYAAIDGTNVTDAVVTVTLTDAAGNVSVDASQSATIDTTIPDITSVTMSGSPAAAGDTITVTMVGESGGSAQLFIADVIDNVPMEERADQPGTYIGIYTATDGTNATDAVVTVTLADAAGNVSSDSSQVVTIDTTVPEITSVTVSGSPAKAGDEITVAMTGDPGESAQFSIAGVAENIPMEESADQPGTYTGTYTATDGTNVTDAVVTVSLTDAVGNVGVDSSQAVTIDTIAPEITSVTVTGTPAGAGDTITVTMVGEPGGLAQFFIADVIDNAPMEKSADQPGTYTGTYTVADGTNIIDAVVTVTLTDAAGNVSTDSNQVVTIDTNIPEITSVTVSGSPARIGEEISVTMTGDPSGNAEFSIAGIVESVPMEESADQPGTYTGTYTVAEDDINVAGAVVTVSLENADGSVGIDASATISIYPPWDVDRDGTVGVTDLVIVASYFGQENPEYSDADVNGDGIVNVLDLILVSQHFGESTASASPGREMVEARPEQVPILRNLYESIRGIPGDSDLIEAKELLARLVGLTHVEVATSRLMQSYPNPCNPETWIPYDLAEPGDVTIRVYSVSGRLIRSLDLGYKEMGRYSDKARAAYWDGTNESGERASSGIYFYVIKSGDFNAVRKLIVAR